ncbi:metal ABC transporter ATP-binding protein [Parapedobacter indicus]|uniref:Manganese/zinc/iron transport system ATP-binding protein n=1 Tax=Parapedobacter indicus TaxID=1477437 RepID=A0A1I3EXZ8_9SPHI|nr:metal ABC transporter ATP-binding protein [Parapedobacter indicus]PPL03451.1 manganese/zinc/iron transport system ATP- binding protein [Parapedobacter indicus]SFI03441.1 manganese/zinc/iron transport system ATP-binding protein [Parapedobacter indicus]
MIIHTQEPILEVHDLTVSYSRKPVLWGIDFTLPSGSIAGIVGPNGAGKSTLLKTIMGLIPPSSGFIKLFGRPLEEIRQRVSYVPQRESVDWDFPVSVLDVVLMGRYGKVGLLRNTGARDRSIALECLDKVGMSAFAKRQISQLSGGQQQRVFLARALAQEADIYFMDEPFAGVDAATEQAIIGLLREMAAADKTIVVVHHDLQSARSYFDWIILLNMHLVAAGPTEQVFTEEMVQQAYGGRLNLLSQVGDVMEKRAFPSREN